MARRDPEDILSEITDQESWVDQYDFIINDADSYPKSYEWELADEIRVKLVFLDSEFVATNTDGRWKVFPHAILEVYSVVAESRLRELYKEYEYIVSGQWDRDDYSTHRENKALDR